MSLILYSNGLTEDINPKQDTYSEEELISIFKDFDTLHSYRFVKILNGWLLWGNKEGLTDDELDDYYNKIASEIMKTEINSHVLFIHDSELSPDWKVTDDVIHFGYEDFRQDIYNLIDSTAEDIINQTNANANDKENEQHTMFLNQIGISKDKRVIFEFNPDKQPKDFYTYNNFNEFANKIINFFKTDYNVSDNLTLYANRNIIISVQKNKVNKIISKLINFFNEYEEYEKSQIIQEVYDGWLAYNQVESETEPKPETKPKRRRGRPRKNKDIDNSSKE